MLDSGFLKLSDKHNAIGQNSFWNKISVLSIVQSWVVGARTAVHFSESFLGPSSHPSNWVSQLNRSTSTDPIIDVQRFHEFFFERFCHILWKMGRLLKSLFICGGTSYQKFDNNIDKSDYLCYKCENCGHQGTVKVRLFLFCFVLNL